MAGNLKGIVLDIGGDTTNLSSALRDVDKQAKTSQNALKQIEQALKFDPTSTDMLNAKQKELQNSLQATESRLGLLREADKTAKRQLDNGEIGIEDYAKLQTEIGFTENKLKDLQNQASGNLDKQRMEMRRAGDAVKELDGKQLDLNERMRLAESQYRETGNETKFAADRSQILSEQVDTQNDKVKEARNALNAARDAYGDNSKAVSFYQKTLDEAEKELSAYEASLREANEALAYQRSELPKAEKEIAALDKQQEQLNHEMKVAEAQFKLTGDQTQLQTDRVRILGDQVEAQEKKLEQSNIALEEATRLYGEGDERVEEYAKEVDKANLELIEMQAELKKSNAELEQQTNKLNQVGKKLEDFGGKLDSVGKGMTVGITAPLMAIAAAAGVAWAEIDDALDGIATNSGAVGDELDALHDSFKNVYKSLPAEASEVSNAIGDINTQFGWTGEELEAASAKVVKFAQINSTTVNPSITGVKGVISALNLEAEDFGRVLDAVTVASQDTGKSTDSLFDTLKKGAPQINDLNLSVEDAAMLLGRMEQAGLDSSRIMGGLTRAQGTAAKEGKTLNQTLADFTKYVQSGAAETDIMNEAVALFGTRNGPAMAQAAQQGVFDFVELADSVRDAGGAVEQTFEATLDPIDMAQVAMNNLKLAGSDLFDAIQVVGTPALEKVVLALQGATNKISELDAETLDMIVKLGAFAVAAGPTVSVLGKMTKGAGQLVTGFGKARDMVGDKGFGGAISSMLGPGGKIMLAVAAIGLLVAAGKKIAEELKPGTAAVRDLIAASEELDEAFQGTEKSIRDSGSIARNIVSELSYLERQTYLTADEQARMVALVDQLNQLYPEFNLTIDQNTASLSESTDEMERRIEVMEAELLQEAYRDRVLEQMQEQIDLEDELAKAKDRQSESQENLNNITDDAYIQFMYSIPILGQALQALDKWGAGVTDAEQDVEMLEQALKEKGDQIEDTQGKIVEMDEIINSFGKTNEDTADKVEAANKEIADSEREKFNALQKAYARERKLRDDYNNNIEDYYSELERLQQGYIDAVDAFGDKEFKLREANAKQLRKYQEDSLKAYLSYETNMNELSKKVPADVLEEMRKLGPDGAHIIQEYVNMTDSELQPYIDTWQSITGKAMDAALEELKGHPAKAAEQALETVRKTREELQKGVGLVEEVAKETVDRYTDAASGMKWAGRDAAKETVDEVKKELDNAPPRVRAAADKAAKSYREGIDEARPGIKTAAQRAAAAAKAGFIVSAYSEGANAGQSFASGLAAKQQAVKNAAAAMAREVPTGLRNVLQIKSPSRVMMGLADDTADGYENQLLKRVRDIEKAADALGKPLAGLNVNVPDIRGVIGDAAIGRHSAINNTNNENITINVETHGAVSDFDARRIGQLVHEGFVLERRSRGG